MKEKVIRLIAKKNIVLTDEEQEEIAIGLAAIKNFILTMNNVGFEFVISEEEADQEVIVFH